MPTMYRVPPELWRIAWREQTVDETTAIVDRERVDYFEDEGEALQLLRRLNPEGTARVLSIHKLENHGRGGLRWVELDYSPPQRFGTLRPAAGERLSDAVFAGPLGEPLGGKVD